jgi:CheY-like chemotaxis protein
MLARWVSPPFGLPDISRGLLSFDRKPGAAVHAVGGSVVTGPPESGAQRTLASLLEMAYGGVDAAKVALAEALALAGRDELPTSGAELVAFVRAHLLESLTEQIGPRLTMALLDDLALQLDPVVIPPARDSEAPPSSVPRPVARIAMHPVSAPRVRGLQLGVLLVDADRVGRTTLARALLRAQSNVTLIDTVADLVAVINADEVVDVMLLDVTHPVAQGIVELLVRSRPEAAVVARGGDVARTRAFLAKLGVTKLDVRSREAPAEELIEALKRATAG